MTSLPWPQSYGVWLARFAFPDIPGVSKVRSVVVVEFDEGNALAFVIKVTSHEPRPDCPGELAILDWRGAGLVKPSTIRCSQMTWLSMDDMLRPLGCLQHVDKARLVDMLDALGILERQL